MSRGITENDVWAASDALLLEGARPTIERVRQKIGRGSPNTVSPYLDTWFRHLGGRIQDPGAFSAPPELPDPVQQAANHLWNVAQAQSRHDFDQRLQAGMATAAASVEAEKERATAAESAAAKALDKTAHIRSELVELTVRYEKQTLARATADAHWADACRQVESLQGRLDSTEADLAALRESARRDVEEAIERSVAAERRAALAIDVDRTARAKAERRADLVERKLESVDGEARAALSRQAQAEVTRKFDAEKNAQQRGIAAANLESAQTEIRRLAELLVIEQRASEHARGEAAAARALFQQLKVTAGPPKARRARVKARI